MSVKKEKLKAPERASETVEMIKDTCRISVQADAVAKWELVGFERLQKAGE